jgi:hypothetical protein
MSHSYVTEVVVVTGYDALAEVVIRLCQFLSQVL